MSKRQNPPASGSQKKKAPQKPRSERSSKRKSSNAAKGSKRRLEKPGQQWEIKHPHAAGIDIGSRTHFVAVGQEKADVRAFDSTTPGLRKMIQWLKERGVEHAAMESTGNYWMPVFEIIADEGLGVVLVDAHQTRHVAGRKSDQSDAQWIQQLHTYGLLSAAFRPAEEICRLRTLVRHRKSLVEESSMATLHMHKMLDEMNLHLHHTLSDLTGVSGLAILEAILRGERDPAQLAGLVDPRVKTSRAQIEAALTGNYREQSLFVLGQALESYRHKQGQLAECDRYIEEWLGHLSRQAASKRTEKADAASEVGAIDPAASSVPAAGKSKPRKSKTASRNAQKIAQTELLAARLKAIIGVDLTAVPGLGILAIFTLLSEIGTEMSRWRNAKAFVSWLGLCPNHKISGGRVLSRGSRRVVSRAATILRVAATTIGKTDTPLGCFFRRKRAQLGAPKAITATARKLACLVYQMIQTQTEYRAMDGSAYEQAYTAHRLKSLKRRAEELGYELTERPAQAA